MKYGSSVPKIERKDRLICPDCDHESPVPGDWIVRAESDRERYVCPVCETTIANRPRRTPPATWEPLRQESRSECD